MLMLTGNAAGQVVVCVYLFSFADFSNIIVYFS